MWAFDVHFIPGYFDELWIKLLHKLHRPKKGKVVLVPNRFWGRHLLGYGSYSFEISQKNFFQTWLPRVYFEISENLQTEPEQSLFVLAELSFINWIKYHGRIKSLHLFKQIFLLQRHILQVCRKKIFGNQSWSGAVLEVNWRFLSADSHATEIGMKTMPTWWLVTSSNSRLTLHQFFSVERDNLSNVQESRTTIQLMKYSLYWEPPSTLSISLITHPHKKTHCCMFASWNRPHTP